MQTIQLSQGKVSLVGDSDFEWFNQWKWTAMKRGNTWYAVRGGFLGPKILMHREIMNAPKDMQVDHINGDGLDNRRENLRVCTNAENGRNRKINKNNKSGFKGVYWSKRDEVYCASIKVNYQRIYLGNYSDPIEAAKSYDEAARKYFGEFASTNF